MLVPVMANYASNAQLGQEIGGAIEVGHLDIRSAERERHVSIAASTARRIASSTTSSTSATTRTTATASYY